MKTCLDRFALLFAALSWSLAGSLPAQQSTYLSGFNPQFEIFKLPGESGSNMVQCIAQDSTGFLWFASQDGLYRYDGYRFVAYRRDPYNDNSIADNYIEWIFIDSKGLLWLAHFGHGISVFDPVAEKFTHYKNDPGDSASLSNNYVSVITEDRRGFIWVGTHDGLNRFDPQTRKFRRFFHNPRNPRSLSYNLVRALYVDKKGLLWVGCGFPWDPAGGRPGGLNRYHPNSESFTRYLHNPANPNSLADNRVRAIFEDSKGNFWIGTMGDGLHLMNRETGAITRLAYHRNNPSKLSRPYLSNKPVRQQEMSGVTFIREDQDGRIWIGAFFGGLNVYDPESNKMHHFEEGDGAGRLGTNFIWNFCQTRDGTVWIACGQSGGMVLRIRPRQSFFSFYQHAAFQTNDWIMGILEARNGKIWLGAQGPAALLHSYDRNGNRTFPYLELSASAKFTGREVFCILEDKDDQIWAGTGDELIRVDPVTGAYRVFKNEPGNPHGLPKAQIDCIFQDSRGFIWVGTFGGSLLRLDPATGRFEHFIHDPANPGSIAGNMIRWIMEDRMGNIWAGGGCHCNDPQTPLFLDRFDARTGRFEHFENTGDIGVAFCMDEDAAGNIWYSDFAHGIRMLNPKTGQIRKYTLGNNHLPASAVRALRSGNDGRIWFSTINSLMVFDPETETFFTFREAQGMPVSSMGWGACFRNKNDELFFAGNGSFISFNPKKIRQLQTTGPASDIAVTGFNLFNTPQVPGAGGVLSMPVWKTNEIRLGHDQNGFTFQLSAFDFSGNQTEFMLENYDQNWRYDLRDGEVTYHNVRPGKYVFRVRNANNYGIWNREDVVLRITVLPPWWKTWWAYLAYFAVFAGIAYTLYTHQINQKLEHAETIRLKELDAFKTRLYANITHEFRTPLTVISGMADQVREQPETWLEQGTALIKRNSNRLLELVNQMLDLAKLESGKMPLHLQQGDLVNYVKYLLESFDSYAGHKGLQLHFHAVPETLTMDYDPEKIRQVLSNLLTNAIKFTPAGGHVYVDLRLKNPEQSAAAGNALVIRVRDTGIGIDENKLPYIFDRFYQVDPAANRQGEGTGIGLALTRELVKLMGGSIGAGSRPGQGTEMTVVLPVQRDVSTPPAGEWPGADNVSRGTAAPEPHSGAIQTGTAPECPLILIAEDNADVVTYLVSCLAGRYNLSVARNGRECIDIAAEIIPDVIISDVMMPYVDGFEACRTLKNDPRTSHIPVIMLTAKADMASRVDGLHHGADAYLAKPFERDELLAHIDNLIESRRRLQQHYLGVAGLAAPPAAEQAEDKFVLAIRQIVERHLDDYAFSVEKLCREAGMSTANLHRKLTALTSLSAVRFIRHVRLGKAKEMLRDPANSITAIAMDTGFNDPSYFGRIFKQEFGITPKEWREG